MSITMVGIMGRVLSLGFLQACLIFAAPANMGSTLQHDQQQQQLSASGQEDGVGWPWFSKAKWGYTEVRPGAHTFWYLEPCRHCWHLPATSRPLVVWLQGGPGASGVGYGNFQEVGPYKIGWETRRPAWTDVADVVFVDNPVGTGFSWVQNKSLLATTDEQVATDLVAWLRDLYSRHPEFVHAPLHVVCESYGGKMGLNFVRALLKEREQDGGMEFNLQGLALGDSWVSPLHFVASWGPLLRDWSLVDDDGVAQLAALTSAIEGELGKNNGTGATTLWGEVEGLVGKLTDNVSWYNLLHHNDPDDDSSSSVAPAAMRSKWRKDLQDGLGERTSAAATRLLSALHSSPLADFMNGEFRRGVGIIPDHVKWAEEAGAVFEAMAGDFMSPAVDAFDDLLEQGVPITIYSGQLDLICDTAGMEDWLATSTWKGMDAFQEAPRLPLHLPPPPSGVAGAGAGGDDQQQQTTAMFYKRHDNLMMYYVMGAGHMVPADQPYSAMQMLYRMLFTE